MLVSATLAALVLGISEGPDLGLVAARGSWPASRGRPGGRRLPAPVGPPSRAGARPDLFRSRSFTVANAATVLYAMGFFAMLLGNILFLTSVWHYSILKAGLAVTPGPLVVAVVSGPAGRVAAAGRLPRPCSLVGFGVFAAGLLWYATRVGLHPAYLAEWLPATLITGLGIGLTFPVLSAAAVSSLHIERFAVGSAVNQTARQVGGALGVALLVVILGTPVDRAQALSDFHHLCGGSPPRWPRLRAALPPVDAGAVGLRPHRLRPGHGERHRAGPGVGRPGQLRVPGGVWPSGRRVGPHPATQGVVPDRFGRPGSPRARRRSWTSPRNPIRKPGRGRRGRRRSRPHLRSAAHVR